MVIYSFNVTVQREEYLEEKMKSVFGTKVSIASKGKGKGKIEIEYYSDDELEHLFDMMMSIKRGE